MQAFNTFSRILLVIINIIVLIFGLAILAFGIIITVGVNTFLSEQIRSLFGSSAPFLSGGITQIDNAGIPFICIGVFITVVTFLGCLGACLENKCILLTYVILLMILIIIQIVAAILLFGGFALNKFKEGISDTIKTEYVGNNGTYTHIISAAIDATMWKLECCGLNNYTDFDEATKWNKEYMTSSGTTVTKQIPLSCCKHSADKQECVTKPSDTNSNWKQGCWPIFERYYYQYRGWGIAFFVVVLVLEAVLVLLTLYVVWISLPKEPGDDKWRTTQPESTMRTMYMPPRRDQEDRYGGSTSDHDSAYSKSMYTPDWYSNDRKFNGSPMYNSNTSFNDNFLYRARY